MSDPLDLIKDWTARDDDVEFVSSSHGRRRLGLLLLLKFFEIHARFPADLEEDGVVDFVARQAALDAASLESYDWEGRTIKRDRAQVRTSLGFRECTVAEADLLAEWLVGDVAASERSLEHSTDQAMIETGRAQKTVFVARYLRDRQLQRAVNDGLNVVESWNRGNSVFFYGKKAETSPRTGATNKNSPCCAYGSCRPRSSTSTHCSSKTHSATIAGLGVSPDADGRGLTPLFWSHVAPYGEVHLNMARRLDIT